MVNRNWEFTHLGLEFCTAETAVLTRIGAASVPHLVANLSEATIRAYGFEPLVHGWRVSVDDEEDDGELDLEKELDRQYHVGNVRFRVAAVLGDIGDTRALPSLEKLLAEITSSPESPVFGIGDWLSATIETAIARIKRTGRSSVESQANTPGSIRLMPTSVAELPNNPKTG